MSLAECLVELQGFVDGCAALPISVLRRHESISTEIEIAIRESYIGKRKRGVFSSGLLMVPLRLFKSRTRAEPFVKSPFQIGLISVRIDWGCRPELSLLFGSQLQLNLLCYGLCHFALQGKYVSKLAIIRFRPEVLVSRCADQLGVDPNPVTLSNNRSFHNGIHAERFGNFWHHELAILEAHDRGARNDPQTTNPGETTDKLFSHAVGEVLLRRISAQVLQRKHSQGTNHGAVRSS